MRPAAAGDDVDADGAVAAALDLGTRGLADDREIGFHQLRALTGDATQAVERGVDLLVVVPDPGDVDDGLRHLNGKGQHHGTAALHVDGSAAPQGGSVRAVLEARGQVVVDRHRVEVAR